MIALVLHPDPHGQAILDLHFRKLQPCRNLASKHDPSKIILRRKISTSRLRTRTWTKTRIKTRTLLGLARHIKHSMLYIDWYIEKEWSERVRDSVSAFRQEIQAEVLIEKGLGLEPSEVRKIK